MIGICWVVPAVRARDQYNQCALRRMDRNPMEKDSHRGTCQCLVLEHKSQFSVTILARKGPRGVPCLWFHSTRTWMPECPELLCAQTASGYENKEGSVRQPRWLVKRVLISGNLSAVLLKCASRVLGHTCTETCVTKMGMGNVANSFQVQDPADWPALYQLRNHYSAFGHESIKI